MKVIKNAISIDEVEADLIYKSLKLAEDKYLARAHLDALAEITPKFKALRDKLLETPDKSDFDLDLQNEGWYNRSHEDENYS